MAGVKVESKERGGRQAISKAVAEGVKSAFSTLLGGVAEPAPRVTSFFRGTEQGREAFAAGFTTLLLAITSRIGGAGSAAAVDVPGTAAGNGTGRSMGYEEGRVKRNDGIVFSASSNRRRGRSRRVPVTEGAFIFPEASYAAPAAAGGAPPDGERAPMALTALSGNIDLALSLGHTYRALMEALAGTADAFAGHEKVRARTNMACREGGASHQGYGDAVDEAEKSVRSVSQSSEKARLELEGLFVPFRAIFMSRADEEMKSLGEGIGEREGAIFPLPHGVAAMPEVRRDMWAGEKAVPAEGKAGYERMADTMGDVKSGAEAAGHEMRAVFAGFDAAFDRERVFSIDTTGAGADLNTLSEALVEITGELTGVGSLWSTGGGHGASSSPGSPSPGKGAGGAGLVPLSQYAEGAMTSLKQEIACLDEEVEKERILTIDTSGAMADIKALSGALSEIDGGFSGTGGLRSGGEAQAYAEERGPRAQGNKGIGITPLFASVEGAIGSLKQEITALDRELEKERVLFIDTTQAMAGLAIIEEALSRINGNLSGAVPARSGGDAVAGAAETRAGGAREWGVYAPEGGFGEEDVYYYGNYGNIGYNTRTPTGAEVPTGDSSNAAAAAPRSAAQSGGLMNLTLQSGAITINGANKSPDDLAREIVKPLSRELKKLGFMSAS